MNITDLPAHDLSDAIRTRRGVVSGGDAGDAGPHRGRQPGAQRDRQPARRRCAAAPRPTSATRSWRAVDDHRADRLDARHAAGDQGPGADGRHPHDAAARRCSTTTCPTADGLMVQRMKAAGCIVIGKTNTPEFGLGSHTFNEVFGATRNAYDPSQVRRRQQRRRGGRAGDAHAAGGRRQRLHGHRCATRRRGTTCSASARARAACRRWPAPDVWVSQLGTEGPMGARCSDVALLLDVQAGYDARAPLSLQRRRDGSTAALRRASTPSACASAGWATSTGYLRDGAGHHRRAASRALRRLEGAGLRSRAGDVRLLARGGLGRLADLAPLAGRGAHRAAPGEPGEPRPDQARGAVGARPGGDR